jgi:2-polyprenyl-3-methyl-5-hydroxy-6-metoxy-1,4-benzoquinol methylase
MSMDGELDAGFWDERYRSADALWSGEPNAQLIAEVSELAPGFALDVGCGEGADTIWLAQRGWRVTAIDISGVALERGRAQAAAVGDDVARRIDWLCADVFAWEPPAGAYDLVSAQFIHFPNPQRDAFFRRLAAAVQPHGTLLIVAHHPSDLQTTARRWRMPEYFYTAEDVEASLEPERWDVRVAEARPREVTDPQGQAITVHDVVLRARRRE